MWSQEGTFHVDTIPPKQNKSGNISLEFIAEIFLVQFMWLQLTSSRKIQIPFFESYLRD